MKIYLLRHGETTGNLARIMDGRTDVPLTPLGEAQARKAGETLSSIPFTHIYCSPLSRAVRTMELAMGRPVEYVIDERLTERDSGALVGLKFEEVDRRAYWDMGRNEAVYPDSESIASLFQRVYAFLDEITATLPEDAVVLVAAHAGVSRAFRCYFEGIPEDGNLIDYQLGNAEFTMYEVNQMKDMLAFIRSRRSTRRFRADMPDRSAIEAVVEAGRYAPSGGNNQTTHLIVITDREILETLADTVKEEFSKMEETPGMYPSLANAIRASKKSFYHFHYDAPVLILTANRIDYGNNMADCACVLENMMLMANALDLGSCWINQLKWLNENERVTACLRPLGLAENERVYGAVSIGYADRPDGLPDRKPLPRHGNPVTWH